MTRLEIVQAALGVLHAVAIEQKNPDAYQVAILRRSGAPQAQSRPIDELARAVIEDYVQAAKRKAACKTPEPAVF